MPEKMDCYDSITICPMTEPDVDAVLEIESDSFPRPWSRVHFIAELNSPHSFPLVMLDSSGLVLGYVCPMLILDEGHILDIAVRRELRGKGLGRLLVERVIAECREKGAEFVSLEVRTSNDSAINLYKRLGFIEIGRRKGYYENGEDALLMEYIFTASEECVDAV